jgi:dipeptidyl aminopeptidase/acylaminoacyl peptidase
MPESTISRQARSQPKLPGQRLFATLALSVVLSLPLGVASASDPVADTRTALRDAIINAKMANEVPLLPREEFLRMPPISDVKLSPDGRYVVYRQRHPQQTDLMLQDLHSNTTTRLLADVRRLDSVWADHGTQLWLTDQNGLAIYTVTTRSAKRVFKWDEKREQRFWGVDATAPAYALVREKVAQAGDWHYRALRIDTAGSSTVLLDRKQPLRGALLNSDGSLAYSTVYDGPHYDSVVWRHRLGKDSVATAEEILRCTGAEQCALLGHQESSNALWLLSHHGEDRTVLKRWQPGKGQAGDGHAGVWQSEHSDPHKLADAASILWQQNSNEWLGIAYHPDRRHWYGRDAARSKQLNTLQNQLPNASLTLTATADGSRWLVQAKHAQWELDRYFLYTPATNRLQPLFEKEQQQAKSFAAAQLAPAVPLHYRARDGLLVHGYVYLPPGIDPAKVPLIAHIHGGPFNRDRDHFNPIVQLLINRGYAVFTPNFRASTGYGQQYMQAPKGDFGNACVLNDILDGMDFLLNNGVGDRKQQAVSGHSFGGYASLLAVSHHPDRFRYAVATAAPIDFNWVMEEMIKYGGSGLPEDGPPADIFMRHHGLRFDDMSLREKLRSESPSAQLPNLRTPIYLWAGAKDDRVPGRSLAYYAGEAKRLNKAVTLLIDPDTGHNPEAALNLEALVYLLEHASAKHFGGGLTPPSAELLKFLNKNLRLDSR